MPPVIVPPPSIPAEFAGVALEIASALKALPGIQGNVERWSLLEEQIKALSSRDDLSAVKARLRAAISVARAEAVRERETVNHLISGIIDKLNGASDQGSSEVASKTTPPPTPLYTPDPLTGLPSRAYAEAELAGAHSHSRDCHLVIFVVKRLALINAKFGYSRGDQVLLKVVSHLTQSLPDFNSLFRWSPCAFLALAPPNVSYKELRSSVQTIELTHLTPTLEWDGRSAIVPVVIDCRIVSIKDFGTPSDLFLRLDTLAADA
jgi:GGDEF domain-containing protein